MRVRLTASGIVCSDITSSFGSSTTKAEGIPLRVTMTIRDFAAGRQPMAGAVVYLWHCNLDGDYSLYSPKIYSPEIVNENYLRGVQETHDAGEVTFTTILPAVYHSITAAAYATAGYEKSVSS